MTGIEREDGLVGLHRLVELPGLLEPQRPEKERLDGIQRHRDHRTFIVAEIDHQLSIRGEGQVVLPENDPIPQGVNADLGKRLGHLRDLLPQRLDAFPDRPDRHSLIEQLLHGAQGDDPPEIEQQQVLSRRPNAERARYEPSCVSGFPADRGRRAISLWLKNRFI